MSKNKPETIEPRYLSLEEAAEYIKVKPRTLRERAQRRQIPFIREGGKLLRFDVKDLIEWMNKNKIQPREIT